MAFTVVEVLVVVAILIVAFSIAYPVFRQAKDQARMAHCISNFRQMHLALTLYRIDEGKDGVLGTPSAMGLPTFRALSTGVFRNFKCDMPNPNSCTDHNPYEIAYMPSDFLNGEEDTDWAEYCLKRQGSAVVFYDIGHSYSCPRSPVSLTRAIAVSIDGTVRKKIRRGNPNFPKIFFHEENP